LWIYQQQGKASKAAKEFQTAIVLQPRLIASAEAWLNLLRNNPEYIKETSSALPDYVSALGTLVTENVKNLSGFRLLNETSVDSATGRVAELYVGVGALFQANGDLTRAMDAYERGLERCGVLVGGQINLYHTGLAAGSKGNDKSVPSINGENDVKFNGSSEIETHMREGLDRSPCLPRTLFGMLMNVGSVAQTKQNYAEAIPWYQEAMRFQNPSVSATAVPNNIGLCYWHLGYQEEAMSLFQSALDIDPKVRVCICIYVSIYLCIYVSMYRCNYVHLVYYNLTRFDIPYFDNL
jgi:tetratricopeptide (TPR) repeat protein